jgi:hypothetical protein
VLGLLLAVASVLVSTVGVVEEVPSLGGFGVAVLLAAGGVLFASQLGMQVFYMLVLGLRDLTGEATLRRLAMVGPGVSPRVNHVRMALLGTIGIGCCAVVVTIASARPPLVVAAGGVSLGFSALVARALRELNRSTPTRLKPTRSIHLRVASLAIMCVLLGTAFGAGRAAVDLIEGRPWGVESVRTTDHRSRSTLPVATTIAWPASRQTVPPPTAEPVPAEVQR